MILQGEIKPYNITKTDAVMSLWMDVTVKAHPFIPQHYWARQFLVVKKQYLPASTTFTYEEDGHVKGFISLLDGSYIGALFVAEDAQSQGIGRALLNHCKSLYDELELKVYAKNTKAVAFYENNGFSMDSCNVDEATEEQEYIMTWISQEMYDTLLSIQC